MPQKEYPQINYKLKEQKTVLTDIFAKIENIEQKELYDDLESIASIHARVELFDAKTKEVKSLAQRMVL